MILDPAEVASQPAAAASLFPVTALPLVIVDPQTASPVIESGAHVAAEVASQLAAAAKAHVDIGDIGSPPITPR